MATLLTGVGYIGATLVRRLVERGGEVLPIVALDSFFSTTAEQIAAGLPDGVRLIDGDVADPRDVGRAFDALGERNVVVYHLAAQPSAAIAFKDPEVTERSNLVGARVVLQTAHERGARVVFGGSFRVYGDDLIGQTIDEERPYGRVGDLSHLSKVYVEQLGRMIGGPFISVRLGVTYGVSPIMKTTPAFMTVPNLFSQRAAHGDVLQVIEDRPMAFIHVRDAAEALVLGAERLVGRGLVWDAVNAAPQVATIGQVAREVQRQAQARGISVRVEGAAASEASFAVESRFDDDGVTIGRHGMATGLGEVLDFFLEKQC